ncbi:conserved membrane hypothetical protein [Candidatus Sulfopaludibacter sp. SbA3]|nr:conserved membrane hypothetical protein [Candidatus Sulfopaludibacter sp. SbA3]
MQSVEQTQPMHLLTYRPTLGWKVKLAAQAAAGIACPLAAYYFTNGAVALLLAATGVALAAFAIAVLLRRRIVLHRDSIEVHTATGNRAFAHAEMQGWKTTQTELGPRISLLPRDPLQSHITIDEQFFQLDEAFWVWIVKLPNLDINERAQSREEILGNPDYGATPDERKLTLARAIQLAQSANLAALILSYWAFLYPRPYALLMALCLVFPWLAILATARSRGLVRLGRDRLRVRPSLMLAIQVPGLAAFALAFPAHKMLRWQEAIAPAVVLGLLLFAAAAAADSRLRKRGSDWGWILALTLPYGCGAELEANALLDHSQPAIHQATVIRKRIVPGRYREYQLQLTPWRPVQQTGVVSVPASIYSALQPGSVACVQLRHGAPGIRWYTIDACGSAGANAP